jgi:hypothetical protein
MTHPQMVPSLTVRVRKTKLLPDSPPEDPRLNCHGPAPRKPGLDV